MKKISTILEIKALVFIVLEHLAFEKKSRLIYALTNEVSKHLGIPHTESMKVIDYLREQKYVRLRERKPAVGLDMAMTAHCLRS